MISMNFTSYLAASDGDMVTEPQKLSNFISK